MTDSNGSTIVPGGQQDHNTSLRTDDFGLGGDLQQQLVDALTAKWNPDDPGATQLPDEDAADDATTDPADTAATPVPAPQPSDSGQPGDEDGAGGGRAADDQGAATQVPAEGTPPSAPTPPAADDAEFKAGDYFDQYFGTPLSRAQAQELAGIIGGLQALSPQQRAQLDATLAGRVPDAYPATMGQPVQQQPGQQPDGAADPAVSILGPRPDDEYAAQQWDITARAFRYQHEQTSAIQQDIARQTQQDQQRQLAAAQTAIDAAETSWRADHTTLSDAEWDSLRDRAVRSQTFPGLLAAHHGDHNAAVNALYEQQFWADPALREKAIANLASGRAPGTGQVDPNNAVAQQQAEVDAGRQALASSVAGGGGSITPQTSEVPRDPEKKKAAMIADLATHDFP